MENQERDKLKSDSESSSFGTKIERSEGIGSEPSRKSGSGGMQSGRSGKVSEEELEEEIENLGSFD